MTHHYQRPIPRLDRLDLRTGKRYPQGSIDPRPNHGAHDALADVRVNVEVAKKLQERMRCS